MAEAVRNRPRATGHNRKRRKGNVTDRYFALTVLLDEDVREGDAAPIIAAIQMIKHVLKVEPHVSDIDTWAAEARAKTDLTRRLWEVLLKEK